MSKLAHSNQETMDEIERQGDDLQEPSIRLALRVEGDWWVAYLAQTGTMDGAKRLGSILMGIVENSPARKEAFMALMQSAMSEAMKHTFGEEPDWNAPQAAPEAERAGRA